MMLRPACVQKSSRKPIIARGSESLCLVPTLPRSKRSKVKALQAQPPTILIPKIMDLLKSIFHPSELLAFVQFARQTKQKESYFDQNASANDKHTLAQCYYFLVKTSRSFAAVVQNLDAELRDPICIFYLVLRGLDTVEDDMTIPLDVKVPLLRCFHEKLYIKGWQFNENGEQEKDRILLQNFDVVIAEFLNLKPCYQQVIADICQKMGNGMADFANAKKVGSKEDWNLYCHYVAGLVGIGLCRMFSVSGLEDPSIANVEPLANSMGLFLQKVNIIRDYLDDLVDGRTFWPEEVWSIYAGELADFRTDDNRQKAVFCLNHLIADTLTLIPDCLKFMSLLRNPTVFRFCAIPQVMAIATLENCFNNHQVFKQNVKIRKGLALKLMLNSNEISDVKRIFESGCKSIASKIKCNDPSALDISLTLGQVDKFLLQM